MLKLRPAITILVVGALFALLGVAPFCPPARAETMPCCDPASHCDEGMRAAGCCRVEPTPEGQQAPALQSPQASRAPRPADWSLIVDPDVTPDGVPTAGGRIDPFALLPHYDPVPLYLLHSTILR